MRTRMTMRAVLRQGRMSADPLRSGRGPATTRYHGDHCLGPKPSLAPQCPKVSSPPCTWDPAHSAPERPISPATQLLCSPAVDPFPGWRQGFISAQSHPLVLQGPLLQEGSPSSLAGQPRRVCSHSTQRGGRALPAALTRDSGCKMLHEPGPAGAAVALATPAHRTLGAPKPGERPEGRGRRGVQRTRRTDAQAPTPPWGSGYFRAEPACALVSSRVYGPRQGQEPT